MKEEGEPQPPTDTSRAGVPEQAMPAAESDPSAPSTRGWTMFTDPGSGSVQVGPPSATAKGRTEMATAPFPDRASSAPVERPEPRATESSDQHLAAEGQKKRGWTMFMDAPIADLAQKAPAAQLEPEPPQVGASDKKGWTVFGEPSPTIGSPSAERRHGCGERERSARPRSHRDVHGHASRSAAVSELRGRHTASVIRTLGGRARARSCGLDGRRVAAAGEDRRRAGHARAVGAGWWCHRARDGAGSPAGHDVLQARADGAGETFGALIHGA
jgi:hypothetical protein